MIKRSDQNFNDLVKGGKEKKKIYFTDKEKGNIKENGGSKG